jgi:pyruvate, water dikinase
MSDRWIYWFEEIGKEQNDLVGKKCANLGELTRLGFSVPSGFALSLDAYAMFMDMTGAAEEMRSCIKDREEASGTIAGITELSRLLRAIVESKPLPAEMETVITSHYDALCVRCGTPEIAVSTRSAGAASHPGQYETHLNVRGAGDVLDKVRRVWSSTFNPGSLSFRKQKGLPLEHDPIGVAVLKMVNARAAGVIFTADPNSGDPSRIIVEANWGLGESVVGGESMPDTYVIDKRTFNVLEKKLGSKARCVLPNGRGVAERETPKELACSFCLSDEEASEIARRGALLEAHFGAPQDAEWAIDDELVFPGSIIWLQTRNEVLAKKKEPVDQLLDMMLTRFVKHVA